MTFRKTGGNGASEFGSYVWGKAAEQHSISPDTNVIAVANDPVAYKGGQCMKSSGGDLTTIGVPALLVAANHLYKPKRGKGRKSQIRVRGGGELDNINQLTEKSNALMDNMTPTTMPSTVHNDTNVSYNAENVPVFSGGNIKQTGAGIITDIAVPAVLLTANHLYKRKSRKTTRKYGRGKSRKNRRSRRVSFRK